MTSRIASGDDDGRRSVRTPVKLENQVTARKPYERVPRVSPTPVMSNLFCGARREW